MHSIAWETLNFKLGQNRIVKKLVGTQRPCPKNYDCPGKASFEGRPI